jgi:lipid A 4'-phosphatase
VIKKIQIELTLFSLLLISVFFTKQLDIGIYNYFSKLNYGAESLYLKGFFVNITELGDSLWFFLIFLLIFTFSFFLKKTKLISGENYSYFFKFSVFGFVYLFLVGLTTQIIKHVVGRPRPNHSNPGEGFELNFLTSDSAFHSFPSGHSSTIIAITIIASLSVPRLRYFFYICGFLIALSRIVVGAHFLSDVIAGTLVAIIVYKIINMYLDNKKSRLPTIDLRLKNTSVFVRCLVMLLIVAVFITVGFKFDVYFSSLFYYGNSQFLLQGDNVVSIIFRKILLPLLLIYIFILPIINTISPIKIIFFGYRFVFKEVLFIWFSGITTLVFIVNFFLKDMWGRSRPNDILIFGGKDVFTPWYRFGDSCISNCSFVSGDASVGFMLFVFYFITQRNIYIYLALFSGFTLGFIRIIAGGHFFSDIVFSQIVVTISSLVFFILYRGLFVKQN